MIKQAIIPLAGLGTRLLPLTSVIPKELLPINGKPGLEYILDECFNAGIKEIIFIISKRKKIIKKYFYNDVFFKSIIKKKDKNKSLKEQYNKIKKFKKMIKFVYQDTPRGTGDALLKCKKLIKSDFFLLLLPDDLILKNNCTLSMIKLHNKYRSSIIATMKVKANDVSRWGILDIKRFKKKNFIIKDVIEKPKINLAPSRYAIIGRYILSKKIFKVLEKQNLGKGNEKHVTDSIKTLIKKNNTFIAHTFSGMYLDCGTMKGYINSNKVISNLKL